MHDGFAFDVFLSHSKDDKPIVRALAKRLRGDGVPVESAQPLATPAATVVSLARMALGILNPSHPPGA